MIRNIFIFSLLFIQFGSLLSFDKSRLTIDVSQEEDYVKNLNQYVWQEVGQIKLDNCHFIRFSENDALDVKSDIVTMTNIKILSYDKDKFEYQLNVTTPKKFIGKIGVFAFLPPTSKAESPNGLYKAEIALKNKNHVIGDLIRIYKKVPKEEIKEKSYWHTIKEHPYISSICTVGVLSFTLWQLNKNLRKLNLL